MAQTTPAEAAAFYSAPWPTTKTSGEARVPCYFSADCRDSSYGNLSVNLDSPAKLIYCHSCEIKGNLIALMFGMKHGAPFDGDKPRGSQFKEIVTDLKSIREGTIPPATKSPVNVPAPKTETELPRNVPLKESENERARSLVTLHESFVTNVELMNEKASAYVRSRPWLTANVMRQWQAGYLPRSAKSLFRGYFMYCLANERNDVVTWFGRDLNFEQKRRDWDQSGRDAQKKPHKTRFVTGFHRGQELFGQHGPRRLQQNPELRAWLQDAGLIVVEGPNDVIRLDTLGAASVGLMSNKATSDQIRKLTRFARDRADNRIVLLPDNDKDGEDGFMRLHWQLSGVSDIDVHLGWSRQMFNGRFRDRQPESLSSEEWSFLAPTLLRKEATV